MTLSEQVTRAINILKDMFKGTEPVPKPPRGATIDSLWAELYVLKNPRKTVKPGVEAAVKVLLEDKDLPEIPIPMVAEIIREVFQAYGQKCKCSESSVRWYQSQRNLEWAIVRRRLPKVEVKDVTQTIPENTP